MKKIRYKIKSKENKSIIIFRQKTNSNNKIHAKMISLTGY